MMRIMLQVPVVRSSIDSCSPKLASFIPPFSSFRSVGGLDDVWGYSRSIKLDLLSCCIITLEFSSVRLASLMTQALLVRWVSSSLAHSIPIYIYIYIVQLKDPR